MGSLYVTFIAILTVLVIILIIRLIDGENIKTIQILNDRSPVHKSIPENVLKKNLYKRTVQNTKTCQNHTYSGNSSSFNTTWFPKTVPTHLKLLSGGEYRPCNPESSTAIIVPYRARRQHLQVFLPYSAFKSVGPTTSFWSFLEIFRIIFGQKNRNFQNCIAQLPARRFFGRKLF